MVKEAIILAGGLGTRLREVIKDIPKPMAPIGGVPFLEILISNLIFSGIRKLIISVGFRKENIIKYFGNSYNGIPILYSKENNPLGTGGAILKAFEYVEESESFVLNGDTFFNIPLYELFKFHKKKKAEISIALRKNDFDNNRYGNVLLSESGRIIGFEEKSVRKTFINGGIYLIKKSAVCNKKLPEKFSFEKDFLEKYIDKIGVYGKVFDTFFVDIGIPEDYERAKREIGKYIKK